MLSRMARIVNTHEAKTHFSRLLAEVAIGEEFLIAKAGEPVARLSPVQPPGREIGFAKDQIWFADEAETTGATEMPGP
jgi:prevent-host-death family protein